MPDLDLIKQAEQGTRASCVRRVQQIGHGKRTRLKSGQRTSQRICRANVTIANQVSIFQRETRLGRRMALSFPLLPPPQKNRSPPLDSTPDTSTPGGISSLSRTSPVRESTRLNSLSSPSQVPCHSSPSIQVTPVTKRLDSMVRRSAPVWGSI